MRVCSKAHLLDQWSVLCHGEELPIADQIAWAVRIHKFAWSTLSGLHQYVVNLEGAMPERPSPNQQHGK